jgi:uncharacterized protein YcbK (DUF882 family)
MPRLPPAPNLVRRRLLRSVVALVPLVAVPGLLRAAPLRDSAEARRLAFYHTHTGETLDVVYSERGSYLPDALAEIHHLCRDFRTGDTHPIDPGLLDLLHEVRAATGHTGRFEIISAYRSPATNRMLANRSTGVADHSLHLQGQAMDVRLPGVRTADLRRVALQLGGGGVGYYPESDFVHIDTGRVRSW